MLSSTNANSSSCVKEVRKETAKSKINVPVINKAIALRISIRFYEDVTDAFKKSSSRNRRRGSMITARLHDRCEKNFCRRFQ